MLSAHSYTPVGALLWSWWLQSQIQQHDGAQKTGSAEHTEGPYFSFSGFLFFFFPEGKTFQDVSDGTHWAQIVRVFQGARGVIFTHESGLTAGLYLVLTVLEDLTSSVLQ